MQGSWKRMHGSAGETVPPVLAQALEAVMPAQYLSNILTHLRPNCPFPHCRGWVGRHQHTVEMLRDRTPVQLMLSKETWSYQAASAPLGERLRQARSLDPCSLQQSAPSMQP